MGRFTGMLGLALALSGATLPYVGRAEVLGRQHGIVTNAEQANSGSETHGQRPATVGNASTRAAQFASYNAPSARYGTGTLHIDNHTNHIIRIYVDGDYIGSVEPLGDLYRRADAASYVLSAKAYFDDGSVSSWGPRTMRVEEDETATWKLYD